MIAGLVMMVGLSAALQQVLELDWEATVINSYVGRVDIVLKICTRLMMARVVMAIFELSASLQ
jgi:hypothetical protein